MAYHFRSPFNFSKRKSLLNVDRTNENSPKSPISLKNDKTLEIEKTSIADFAIYPLKERKNRYKQHFIVLLNSEIYLYRKSNDFQKRKQPKIIINLKNIFNISFYKDSETIKSQITIMSDLNTYFIRISETTLLYEWYEILLEKIRVFRSIALQRDVNVNEFFDIAFDCTISVRPKMKKNYGNQQLDALDDLYDKITSTNHITPRVRFCMYYNLVVICNIGIQASHGGCPPFNSNDYIKFPTNVIRDFGKQEKYIFLRIGRCSEVGCGELWFKMESIEKAKEAHIKIMELFDSATEKRKSDVRKYSSQNLAVRMPPHRERSFTNPIAPANNKSLNIEEKSKRAKTWDESVEEPKKRISYSNTSINPNTSSNSRKSSRNLSPALSNIENSDIDLNDIKLENNEKVAKKSSINEAFPKFSDLINNRAERNSDSMSHRGSIASISSAVENMRRVSCYNNDEVNTDFCYVDDVRKLSTSALDSKILVQKSNRFARLNISPKRQQSFTLTNLSPLIQNSSNALLTTDYVVMDSVDTLNIPLTNSSSNVTSPKDSLKLDEVKSFCSDKSDDGVLRSRTNTNVSRNTVFSSERSRVNTFASNKSDNSINSGNNLTISSQFVNDDDFDSSFNRKRSYSLGNKNMVKQHSKDNSDFIGEFESHRCRTLSLNTGTKKNGRITLAKDLKLPGFFDKQFKLSFSDDILLNSNKSFLDRKNICSLLMENKEDIDKEEEPNKIFDNDFLFEKTIEISTKLPTTSIDNLSESNFNTSENLSLCKNNDNSKLLVDYTYDTFVIQNDNNSSDDIPSTFLNYLNNDETSKKIVCVNNDNNFEELPVRKFSANPIKLNLKDSKRHSLFSISPKNEYTFLEKLHNVGKKKDSSDNISKNF
ncbi:Insulin receptor substrate-1, PTB domain and Pleckstrin homology-like domain-containing protein [Strongyloides ratti]|uniref:Insulin receptor substrate-1, PTB domain and Pleckstrin homology-like domain-containing protein n=1 Tax=Strongyloides ratti TaxID=34506 RepID=A0A090MW07_STRRB|nr:Insulin receptor substrate-1, PTB domain and Pleckstrin homology-like domain-containing protein [Strongyloides ratti]CEF63283.1 Insulin receptor substrate-1, PTB domain and Pleckstrin homology-like domain-containing protein [Strongyloides ratti]